MDPELLDEQQDDTTQDDDLQPGDDPTDDEPGDGGEDGGTPSGEGGTPADGDVEISIGDPDPADEDGKHTAAPDWVKDLRRSNREKDKVIRDLEKKLQAVTPATQTVVVGEKPTLEGCGYDAEKFEQDLEAWHNRKREADEQRRTQETAEHQQRAQWQARMDAVGKAASAIKVPDAEDAVMAFESTFSALQQGIILGGPDDPKTSAQLRIALGKSPKLARELAAVTDPVKFAMRLQTMVDKMKITPRKAAPAPDTPVRSSVGGAAAVDNQLLRLQAEADKTGDRSKVAKYLRDKQRAKQAA